MIRLGRIQGKPYVGGGIHPPRPLVRPRVNPSSPDIKMHILITDIPPPSTPKGL